MSTEIKDTTEARRALRAMGYRLMPGSGPPGAASDFYGKPVGTNLYMVLLCSNGFLEFRNQFRAQTGTLELWDSELRTDLAQFTEVLKWLKHVESYLGRVCTQCPSEFEFLSLEEQAAEVL